MENEKQKEEKMQPCPLCGTMLLYSKWLKVVGVYEEQQNYRKNLELELGKAKEQEKKLKEEYRKLQQTKKELQEQYKIKELKLKQKTQAEQEIFRKMIEGQKAKELKQTLLKGIATGTEKQKARTEKVFQMAEKTRKERDKAMERVKQLEETIKRADVVLMGPGLEESKKNSDLLKKILTGYKNKKVVLDATSLWQLNPEWLNENCIVTPHKKEFEKVFGAKPIPQNVLKMASKYHCVVLLKGQSDYISDGEEIYENKTGNEGMTKGGTGDALAGIVAGFYYSAEDLVEELGNTFAELIV